MTEKYHLPAILNDELPTPDNVEVGFQQTAYRLLAALKVASHEYLKYMVSGGYIKVVQRGGKCKIKALNTTHFHHLAPTVSCTSVTAKLKQDIKDALALDPEPEYEFDIEWEGPVAEMHITIN